MRNIFRIILLTLLTLIVTHSCSRQKSPVVAIALAELSLDRWERDMGYLKDFFEGQNCRVITQVANNDYQTQLDQMRKLIQQKVDVMVVIPVQSKGYREVVDLARQNNVRIISYDRLIEDADIDFYLTFDNLQVGVNQANYILNNTPARNFALINGPETDFNAVLLHRGQASVLKSYRLRHRVNVTMDKMLDEYSEDAGYAFFKSMLEEGDVPDAVIAGNDAIARGAIRALEESGLDKEVYFAGQDADKQSLRLIMDEKQLMTVYKPVKRLASITFEVVMSYLEGLSPHEYDLTSTYNGFKNVPTIILGTIMVDKENIRETVITDGFFKLEEIK